MLLYHWVLKTMSLFNNEVWKFLKD